MFSKNNSEPLTGAALLPLFCPAPLDVPHPAIHIPGKHWQVYIDPIEGKAGVALLPPLRPAPLDEPHPALYLVYTGRCRRHRRRSQCCTPSTPPPCISRCTPSSYIYTWYTLAGVDPIVGEAGVALLTLLCPAPAAAPHPAIYLVNTGRCRPHRRRSRCCTPSTPLPCTCSCTAPCPRSNHTFAINLSTIIF